MAHNSINGKSHTKGARRMRGLLSYFLILSLSISSFSLSTGAPNGITSSKLEMKTLEVAYLFEEGKGKKNCGCGQDPCITYGKQTEKCMPVGKV